jgi:ABC-type amino acid transport substrate-binding protein
MGAQYCAEQHLDTLACPDVRTAVQSILNHDTDAIVHDAMTLQWYDSSHPELPITEVGPIFDKKFYGFVLPIGSTLRHEINQAIVDQNESGFLETLRKHYFGDIQ